jgi:hypothetical protein
MGHRMRAATAFTAALFAMALLVPIARGEAPPLALALSDGQVRLLEQELRDDLHALDAFARQRPSGAPRGASAERPGAWMLYGRLGPLNFRNEHEQQSSGGVRFSVGRTGPRLTGRVYIGLHRRFH